MKYDIVWGAGIVLSLLMVIFSFLMPELLEIAQLFLGAVFLAIFMKAFYNVRTSEYQLVRTWSYTYMAPLGIIAISMFAKGVFFSSTVNRLVDLVWIPMVFVLIFTGLAFGKSLKPIFEGEHAKISAHAYKHHLDTIEKMAKKKYKVRKSV